VKPINIVLLATLIAVGGTWSKKGSVSVPMVVGGATLALGIVVMDQTSPKLAEQFAWLMLASTVGAYGQDLFTTVGNVTTGKKLNDPNAGEK
jgi:hypothetical protein